MTRLDLPALDVPDLYKALTLDPEVGTKVVELTAAVYASDALPKRVREAVRMRIALVNDCAVCRSTRMTHFDGVDDALYDHVTEWQTYGGYSPAERIAIEYAERFALDHHGIDDEFVAQLHEHFTDAQLVTLTASIGYFLAYGRFTKVFELYDACTID